MNKTGCFFRSREDVHYAVLQHEFNPITGEMGAEAVNPRSDFFPCGLCSQKLAVAFFSNPAIRSGRPDSDANTSPSQVIYKSW